MQLDKMKLMVFGIGGGILLFFIGLAAYFAIGPSTTDNLLPRQVSSVIKLTGMGILCISMIVGGFFIDKLDKDTKSILIIFGFLLLLLNIFVVSYT
jgi:hypothetical protein